MYICIFTYKGMTHASQGIALHPLGGNLCESGLQTLMSANYQLYSSKPDASEQHGGLS